MTARRLLLRLIGSAAVSLALVATPAIARDPTVGPEATVASADAPARPDRERARMNQRVFDRVWSEVRGEYYDPALHGVDWNSARRAFRPRALAAPDDRAQVVDRHHLDVLAAMLDDRAQDEAADAAETVDGDANGHGADS